MPDRETSLPLAHYVCLRTQVGQHTHSDAKLWVGALSRYGDDFVEVRLVCEQRRALRLPNLAAALYARRMVGGGVHFTELVGFRRGSGGG